MTGGTSPTTLPAASTSGPPILADVENSWRVAQEEIFGPVACLMPFDHRGGGDPARQRHGLRALWIDLDTGPRARDPRGQGHPHRRALGELLAQRAYRGALRRVQAERHGPRDGHARREPLHGGQERLLLAGVAEGTRTSGPPRATVGRFGSMTDLPEELANRPQRKPGHEPSATITLDAYVRLKAELDELTSDGRTHIAERLKVAREHGDIRENAEYDAAKNEQGLMESRIRNLQRMLRDPEIVEAPASSERVGAGMLVTLRPLDDDDPEDETYLLAESAEERAPGVRTITMTSPLGTAVQGAKLDDRIAYEAPAGTVRYLVVGFEPRA